MCGHKDVIRQNKTPLCHHDFLNSWEQDHSSSRCGGISVSVAAMQVIGDGPNPRKHRHMRDYSSRCNLHRESDKLNNGKENLKLGGLGEVLPLLDDVVPVDVAELHPELTDDVVFGESVEVKNLHHHRRLQEGRLGYLRK